MHYPLYFDYNATTPCDPQVMDVMLPYFGTHFGNAASKAHAYGWVAGEAVEMAREQVAALIGAVPQEVIFTSGATESVNLAIRGVAEAYAAKGNHIITYATEHKAVLDVCTYLAAKQGKEVTVLPVGPDGQPDLQQLEDAIRPTTVLIAAMYANNETGVIFPVKEISAIARRQGVLFFCDATQAAGKIPVDVRSDGSALLAFSAHKMYGPKGVGALYVSRKDPRVTLAPLQHGGGHERNMRSGTLNVPGIVGFGKAAVLCKQLLPEEAERLAGLRDRLIQGFADLPGVVQNGDIRHRLPHVSNICFGFEGGDGMLRLLTKQLAVAAGSACTSASPEPSHVLKAMQLSNVQAAASIRFSLGRFTTDAEVEQAIVLIRAAATALQSNSCS
ncbi:MAG TPA: aminotransferase class V-fold PLP-dependent enzyme [Lacibacter sp.]|mgnify:CR=1 FL=1|nr:aminotransferase class V-fold PLP-dependent enzyme [Lacibacter sp.]HMO89231.1 aminotransferase class V-fold PLP-dependent enzyme [Lacibacter sp.]HMP87323.1 aminotransferase class V-fold PLP-dependent enzyme [Lacibacter sp.]